MPPGDPNLGVFLEWTAREKNREVSCLRERKNALKKVCLDNWEGEINGRRNL